MDAVVAQIVGGFKTAIGMYENTLGANNAKLREAKALLAALEAKAAKADIMSFTTTCGAELAKMGELIGALAQEKPAPKSAQSPSTSSTSSNAAVAQAAAGFHQAYGALSGQDHLVETRRVYERVFAIEEQSSTPIAFHRALAEENLHVKMSSVHQREIAQNQIALVEQTSQPAMVRCHQSVTRALAQAKSTAQIEYATTAAAEIANVETAWDRALLSYADAVIGAVTAWWWVKDEAHRQSVEDAARFSAHWLGKDFDALMRVPRVRDHVEKVLVPASGRSYAEFVAAVSASVVECTRGKPPIAVGKPATLTLWSTKTTLDAVHDTFARAPRPV